MERKKRWIITMVGAWTVAMFLNFPYFIDGYTPSFFATASTILYLVLWVAGIFSLQKQLGWLKYFAAIKILSILIIPSCIILKGPTMLLVCIAVLFSPYYGIRILSAHHNSPFLYIVLVIQAMLLFYFIKNHKKTAA